MFPHNVKMLVYTPLTLSHAAYLQEELHPATSKQSSRTVQCQTMPNYAPVDSGRVPALKLFMVLHSANAIGAKWIILNFFSSCTPFVSIKKWWYEHRDSSWSPLVGYSSQFSRKIQWPTVAGECVQGGRCLRIMPPTGHIPCPRCPNWRHIWVTHLSNNDVRTAHWVPHEGDHLSTFWQMPLWWERRHPHHLSIVPFKLYYRTLFCAQWMLARLPSILPSFHFCCLSCQLLTRLCNMHRLLFNSWEVILSTMNGLMAWFISYPTYPPISYVGRVSQISCVAERFGTHNAIFGSRWAHVQWTAEVLTPLAQICIIDHYAVAQSWSCWN
jgi:hypothetical protein